jgi:hypothetical protein
MEANQAFKHKKTHRTQQREGKEHREEKEEGNRKGKEDRKAKVGKKARESRKEGHGQPTGAVKAQAEEEQEGMAISGGSGVM